MRLRNRSRITTRKLGAAIGAAVLGLGLAASAPGAVISTNFVGGQTDPGSGGPGAASVSGEAGVVPSINWNNIASNTASNLALNDSAGNVAANVTFSVNNTWAAVTNVPADDNGRMMNGYLDNFQNQTVTVAGLGSAFTGPGYDVVVYQNADSAGAFGFRVADNAGHTATLFGRQLGAAGQNYPLSGPNGFVQGTDTAGDGGTEASNYVRFTGLTGDTFTITGVSGNAPGGDNRTRPNGFQIVSSVPEPTSLALLGVGLLALTRRRRAS